MTFTDTLSLVWPMAFLLLALFILRKVESDLRPVLKNVIGGVATNAQTNALRYAMAIMLASLSSMQALSEVATSFGWLYVAAFAKIATPGLAAIVAYVQPSPQQTQPAPQQPPATTL